MIIFSYQLPTLHNNPHELPFHYQNLRFVNQGREQYGWLSDLTAFTDGVTPRLYLMKGKSENFQFPISNFH
jgi:hypothetical protein